MAKRQSRLVTNEITKAVEKKLRDAKKGLVLVKGRLTRGADDKAMTDEMASFAMNYFEEAFDILHRQISERVSKFRAYSHPSMGIGELQECLRLMPYKQRRGGK